MGKKITVAGLAGAINEYLDAMAVLAKGTHGNNVYPTTIARAELASKRLDRMMKEVNKEARDESTRRVPKKETRSGRRFAGRA